MPLVIKPRQQSPKKSTQSDFTVTQEALMMARVYGIGGDTHARVCRMARRAAPFTHPRGNRRFDDYVLDIQDGIVLSVGLIDPTNIKEDVYRGAFG